MNQIGQVTYAAIIRAGFTTLERAIAGATSAVVYRNQVLRRSALDIVARMSHHEDARRHTSFHRHITTRVT